MRSQLPSIAVLLAVAVVGRAAEPAPATRQVMIQALVLQAPAGFANDTGIAVGNEGNWVLSERELRMFTAHLREAKKTGRLDVLTRPQLQIVDGQTGTVQVGTNAEGIIIRATPRVQADGTVLLRAEPQISSAVPGGVSIESLQATGTVRDGHTLVVRATGRAKHETLYLFTVHIVKGETK